MLLAAIACAWIGARIVLWEAPGAGRLAALADAEENSRLGAAPPAGPGPSLLGEPTGEAPAATAKDRGGRVYEAAQNVAAGVLQWAPSSDRVGSGQNSPDRRAFGPPGHHALFLAAMRYLPVPVVPAGRPPVTKTEAAPPPLPPKSAVRTPPIRSDRWSLGAWAFWRQRSDAGSPALASLPSYGASQIGGVLQNRLDAHSGHDPRAYLRGYKAINDAAEAELSLGLSFKPVPALPLRGHAELRHAHREGQREVRAGAFVTTELPRLDLPLEASAEVYAQAGYVGGEFETLFADAQAIVTRDMIKLEPGDLAAGAGVWLGAQRGVHRIDLGPTVRFDFDLGTVPARLSLDWRERVAGEAEPASGLAATISTQF